MYGRRRWVNPAYSYKQNGRGRGARGRYKNAYPLYKVPQYNRWGPPAFRRVPAYRGVGNAQSPDFRSRWGSKIPKTLSITPTYYDCGFSVTLAIGNLYTDSYVFRGNSLHDPDFTGVGSQPYMWDQLGGVLYNYYMVLASKITVEIASQYSVTNTPAFTVHVIPHRATSVTYEERNDLHMMPYAKKLRFSNSPSGLGEAGYKIENYCKTRQMFPERDSNDASYIALYNANPTLMWYWLIFIENQNYEQADTEIFFDVKIRYYAQLHRRVQLDES